MADLSRTLVLVLVITTMALVLVAIARSVKQARLSITRECVDLELNTLTYY